MSTQSTLQPSRVRLGRMIHRTQAALVIAIDAQLAVYGVTAVQLAVLAAVDRGHADTASRLCRQIPCTAGAMTRLIDRLQQKGLIVRTAYEGDRRAYRLTLSARARLLLPSLIAASDTALEQCFSSLGASELAQLEAGLMRIRPHGCIPAIQTEEVPSP